MSEQPKVEGGRATAEATRRERRSAAVIRESRIAADAEVAKFDDTQVAEEHVEELRDRIGVMPSPSEAVIQDRVVDVPSISPDREKGAKKDEERKVGLWQSLKQSRMAKMLLVAAGLHAPFTPQGREVISKIVDGTAHASKWAENGLSEVLRPQSVKEMADVTANVTKREAGVDRKRVDAFKREMRDKMERGEPVSFEDLYLEMERLKGIDGAMVDQAKTEAHERINRFSNGLERVDHPFLQKFVHEMYGPDSNYDWGQASVARYFVTGKRNCVSIAKSEAVVLEGVMQHLSPEERSKYEIGINKIKQHEIAVLTYRDNGKETTYYLEGDVRTLEGATEDAGSKTIPLSQIKQGIVAEKPIIVDAKEGRVEKSPDIIAVTDQPVDDGIQIKGELRGSEYVIQQAEAQGVRPEVIEQKPTSNIIELTIENTPEEDRKAGREILDQHLDSLRAHRMADGSYTINPTLDLGKLSNPSLDKIRGALPSTEDAKTVRWVDVGTMNAWSPEVIRETLHAPISELKILVLGEGILPEKFLKELEQYKPAQGEKGIRKITFSGEDSGSSGGLFDLPNAQVERFLKAAKEIPSIDMRKFFITNSEVYRTMAEAPQKEIFIPGQNLTAEIIEVLGKGHPQINIPADEYMRVMAQYPQIIKYSKIQPHILGSSMSLLLSAYQAIRKGNSRHAALPEVKQMLLGNGYREEDLK